MTKHLVKIILENPHGYNWSLQGFGMMRLYLSKEVRLHLWNSGYRAKDVSTIHDHPWDFDSLIVAGRLKNVRYAVDDANGVPHKFCTIQCGVGGCQRSEPQPINLRVSVSEQFEEGDSYTQTRQEIHDSFPEDGTVTVITRRFTSADEDHARVFWRTGDWVTGEPRPATPDEIDAITKHSLARWFQQ